MTEIKKAIPGVMTKFKLTELSGVTRPAQGSARVAIMKLGDDPGEVDPIIKRAFTADQRKKLANTGAAMPDGGFPIENNGDLNNAIQAFGRAKNKDAAKRHIIARAKALGASDSLPESWMTKAEDDPGLNPDGGHMSNAIKKALGLADTATEEEVTAAVIKLGSAEVKATEAKLAKAEAKSAYLAVLAKARPKDKAMPGMEPDADDEPDSAKAKKFAEFMAKSESERDALIAKATEADETLTVGGASIRKSVVGEASFSIMKAQQAQIEANAADLKKAREETANAGFTKSATDDYGHLAGSVGERVLVLKHLSSADEPTRKAADAILKAAEATAKLAFTKLGHGQGNTETPEGGGAEAKLEKMAKERQASSGGKLTFEKAYDEVMQENPSLYSEVIAGKPVATQ